MTQATFDFEWSSVPRSARDRRTNLPFPWQRIDGGRGKLGATYAHPSGYWMQQCGHPTALWPYALYTPEGYMVLAQNGRAFQNTVAAAVEVDRLLAGGEPHEIRRPIEFIDFTK